MSSHARIGLRFTIKKLLEDLYNLLYKWYFIIPIRVGYILCSLWRLLWITKIESIEITNINIILFVYSAKQQYLNIEAAHFLCVFSNWTNYILSFFRENKYNNNVCISIVIDKLPSSVFLSNFSEIVITSGVLSYGMLNEKKISCTKIKHNQHVCFQHINAYYNIIGIEVHKYDSVYYIQCVCR